MEVPSPERGEMANATTSGTMLDAFLMVEIVAGTLQAVSARMLLLKPNTMLDANLVAETDN